MTPITCNVSRRDDCGSAGLMNLPLAEGVPLATSHMRRNGQCPVSRNLFLNQTETQRRLAGLSDCLWAIPAACEGDSTARV